MEAKLMTLDWDKITRPVQGSLWAHNHDHSQAPEIDMLQLESFFSATSDRSCGGEVGLTLDAPTIIPRTFQLKSNTRSLQFARPSEGERLSPLKEPTTAVKCKERGRLPVKAVSGFRKKYLWLKIHFSALRNRPSSSTWVSRSIGISSNAYSSDYIEPENYASSNISTDGMDFPDYFLSQARACTKNDVVNNDLHKVNTQPENTTANLDYTTNLTTLPRSTPPPPPPPLKKGNSTSPFTPPRPSTIALDWNKVPKHSIQGTLWGGDHSHSATPEIDILQLESLFPAATDRSGGGKVGVRRGVSIKKPEIVHLIDLRRAMNCEIILVNIKIPFPNMMDAVLKLDSSVLDIDQVENLIKCCPTEKEMELLENYNGDRAKLGKCEKFFLELKKVPRVKSKLQVFACKITFSNKVNELRRNLDLIDVASKEIKESLKLRQIMFTILRLGNALNQGTARGSAVGFKLESLLKLSETRARNRKMTLMHYLCKLLAEKAPELLDLDKDLYHLGAASKIQLKLLTEEMRAVSNDFEKVEQEFSASENDEAESEGFRKTLKNFLDTSEAEVRSLTTLYAEVGRSADSLSQYLGEDPAKCSFERVTEILHDFVMKFRKSREENAQQASRS